MTYGGLLNEGWYPKRPNYDNKLEIFSSTPHSLETGEGKWSKGSMMPSLWSLCKYPNSIGFRELVGWWSDTHEKRMEAVCPWAQTLPCASLPSDCSSVSSIIFFYNKGKSLVSWILWATLVGWSDLKRGSWEPLVCSRSVRSTAVWTSDCHWKWKVWDWVLNLWDLRLLLGRQCQNYVVEQPARVTENFLVWGSAPHVWWPEVLWVWS